MTLAELTRLKEICEKATPGPWFVAKLPWDDRSTAIYGNRELSIGPSNDPHGARLITDCDVTMEWIEGEPDGSIEDRFNAAFIAEARTALPALIAEVERLREALEKIAEQPNRMGLLADEIVDAYPDIEETWALAREALGGGG
jgi:hypothetical protein